MKRFYRSRKKKREFSSVPHQILLVMKLMVLFLTVVSLSVSARSFSQTITWSGKNVPLEKVFSEIEQQTGYAFFYNDADMQKARPVTLSLKNENLKSALGEILKNQMLTYSVEGKTIFIHAAPVENFLPTSQTLSELQQNPVHGTVMDAATKHPLIGVTVQVKGTSTGTTTGENGEFSLSAPDNAVLVFSYVGYQQKEVAVNGRPEINLMMEASVSSLNQLVVVGYGTEKRKAITGAIDQISDKDIEHKPVTNVLDALQGESPNLIIQKTQNDPGSGVNLNIRGIGTLGDNTPLIVIDGIVGGDINQVNPADIKSVTILKDAGAAAIYGSRAANGVILVTTKSGQFNSAPKLSFDATDGFQHPDILLKKVDAWDNAYYRNLALVNSGLPPSYTPAQIAQLKAQGNGTWDLEHVLKDAPFQTYNIALNGGGVTNAYYLSAGYQNQGNNMVGNGGSGHNFGYQEYNVRMNEKAIIGKLNLNVILSYNVNKNKTPTVDEQFLFADAERVPHNYNWQDSAGNYLTNPISSQLNELGILEKGGYNQTNNNQFFGNVHGTLNITSNLSLTGLFGGTIINNSSFYRAIQVNDVPSGVSGNDRTVSDNSSKSLLTNTQVYAEYNKTFKLNNIHVLLGVSNESSTQDGFQLLQTLTDEQLGMPTTGTIIDASNSHNSNAATTQTSINSAFGRLSYSYDNKYFIDGTFREDGSSKFAKDHRWGFFPSIGASWLVTEEPFMKTVTKTLSTLKLRASYGELGNQNVSAYQYQTAYFNYQDAYGFNNQVVSGAGYRLGNPDLTWERAAMLNLGTDLGLFQDKLHFTFDYFNKVTSDILYPRQDVPALFGAGLPDYNVAKVRDQGWGISASYSFNTNKVKQSISLNLADNHNKLLALTFGSNQQIINMEEYWLIRQVGEPVTQYYGYKVAGIFQNEKEIQNSAKPIGLTVEPGDLKYVDENHDGIIDNKDRVLLGNPFPRYTFGFTYRISVDNFDLSLFIQGVGKRTEMIRGETVTPYQGNYSATMFENQTDVWTPTNRNAKYPRLSVVGSDSYANNWTYGSNIYAFNAAYARLQNINIGYTLPQKITKRAGIEDFRISIIGQNLITLSKLNFLDPETSEFNNDLNLNAGENSARLYPLPIFYGLGLNVTFQ